MIVTMREEEKLKLDRMARDLEIKWTENLRQVLFPFIFSFKEMCILIKRSQFGAVVKAFG